MDPLRIYLRRLLQEEKFEQAYALWVKALPEGRRPSDRLLYNAAFADEPTNMVFDWTLDPIQGAHLTWLGAPSEPMVRLEFAGGRIPFDHFWQVQPLVSGVYRFSGEELAQNLETERGLMWKVSCISGSKADLAQTEPLRRSKDWQKFEIRFFVPPQCRAVRFGVMLPHRVPSEQVIAGSVSYRKVSLRLEKEQNP